MQAVIDAIVAALENADFAAVKSILTAAPAQSVQIAVGVKSARQNGAYEYLGQRQVDGQLLPYYGKNLALTVFFRVYAPRTLGCAACLENADALAAFLTQGISGVKLDKLTVGEARFDGQSDCFVCELTADCDGRIYATANEDETEFTDFILKGEAK